MIVNDITITSLETITAFSVGTGIHRFTLDELQNAKIANTQDKTDITGKGGRKLNSLKKNKAVVVSGTNGLVSAGLMSAQVGTDFEDKEDAQILWTDYLEAKGGKATTNYHAVGSVGNEIETLYVKNEDGTLGKKLTQSAPSEGGSIAEGTFTYDPATGTIEFAKITSGDREVPEVEDGTELVAYYMRSVGGYVVENNSNKYSDKCTLYIDAMGEDKCSNVYRVQFYIPKADFSGNFDIDLGGDQTVHAFEAESLAGACGTSGSLWTYTIFGANTKDDATSA